MVYESDFYTTRRPYRAAPSLSTYTITKREIPWEKVPFVPRPSLVPDPVTAWGKRKPEKPRSLVEKATITPLERAMIRPKVLVDPPKPYVSAREQTREKVLSSFRKPTALPDSQDVDVLLSKVHKLSEMKTLPYKRNLILASYLP